MALTNSMRSLPKATYVSLKGNPNEQQETGRALEKFGYVRRLLLQNGEVDSVLKSQSESGPTLGPLLRQFEGTPLTVQLPSPSNFADVLSSELIAFGQSLAKARQKQVPEQPSQSQSQSQSAKALSSGPNAVEDTPELPLTQNTTGASLQLLNSAIAATNAFTAATGTPPIGWLNLERMEMTPAGIEQGELIATIALAPKEQTSVIQQEWSVINQEFSSIVTDSLDNFSQTGVTENSELAQATTSQNSHSNQFNVTASASGGCGFVSGSASTGFGSQDQNSASASDSRKHAVATTRAASSRVTQSRKVTISTSSTTGSSVSTTRTLQNPSDTEPMRIDYFSMMRKWHVGLYRYGLRLTYDLTVPEPGAAMREAYKELDDLMKQAANPFEFSLSYSDITENSYPGLASQFGAEIQPPPAASLTQMVGGPIPNLKGDGNTEWVVNQVDFTVPEGYEIEDVSLELLLNNTGQARPFYVMGSQQPEDVPANQPGAGYDLTAFNKFLKGAQGSQTISYFVTNCGTGLMVFTITQKLTNQTYEAWVASAWSALYSAAQTTFLATQSQVQAKIAALQDKLRGVDTLTLRREENDEIMKSVLRWLLGTNFEFVPQQVVDLFQAAGGDLTHGISFTGNNIGPDNQNWSIMYQYEAMVNFINEAIEWENVVYFLYSYFWDVPPSWDFIRQIQHPDATRQAFLRAGSSRVLLTVRQGFEVAWTSFAERGDLNLPPGLPTNYPYLTIAQQIQDYNNTNYPGIPAANPNGGGPVDANIPQVGTTCSSPIDPGSSTTTPVDIPVADSKGFVVGATAIIDSWESGVQENQTITAVPDSTTITVQGLLHSHNLTMGAYPIVQASAKGTLIAEWFEYTPSPGTLIAVNSNLTTIA